MKLYGLGALELFDGIYDIETVAMTIYQPRRNNISTFTLSKDELYKWANEILKPTAKLALVRVKASLDVATGGTFCKIKHECRHRADHNLELAKYEFKLPPLLEDEDIEEILGKIDELHILGF